MEQMSENGESTVSETSKPGRKRVSGFSAAAIRLRLGGTRQQQGTTCTSLEPHAFPAFNVLDVHDDAHARVTGCFAVINIVISYTHAFAYPSTKWGPHTLSLHTGKLMRNHPACVD